MSKNIQHKRSSIAGNVPDDTQIAVGELAINFPDQTLYTKDGNGQIIDVGRSQEPEAVLDPDNCTSPEFQGGSGTESDPFQVFAQANIGDGDIHVATATITGLEAGQVVYIKDLQAQTNGDRFTAGARVADESGVLTVNITLSDNPQSSDSTTYQGKLRIGGTIYIDADVGVLEFLEGGSTLATPNTPAPSGPILWAGSSARIITATYPLLISDDGYYFTDKIEANLGTQIWTKWAGDPGSGVGIDEPHGTTIRGVVTDGIGAQFFQLTIDKKTAFLFHNFVDSDQTLGGTSESRVVTVRDVNSYVYPFGTSTGTSPEYVKNGGSWTATPATNAGSATDYMIEGDEFQLRHQDAATNDTASTYNFNMAGDSADWTTVTAPPSPTILQPKIASPATDGALDISTSGPFVSSDFEMAVGTDTHTASSWEVTEEGDDTIVASLYSDTSALTSWEPDGLEHDEDYTVRVKHHTATLNSEWSEGRSFKTEANLAGIVWTLQPSYFSAVGDERMYGLVWTGTQFCSVGIGKCATSPDGVTWTNQTGLPSAVGSSTMMNSVAWDGTQFCAVGTNGKLATSPDGVTWTRQMNFTPAVNSKTMQSIVWTGTQFCAVGLESTCATSPDGVTWTNQPSLASLGSGGAFYSVIWTGTQFCTVGSYGICATSPDGVTWTLQPSLATEVSSDKNCSVEGVVWDGTQFCAVGAYGRCATSPDGVTWTNQTGLPSAVGTGTNMRSVAWDGSKFCAVGYYGKCATSPDGVTWTLQPSLPSEVGTSSKHRMNSVVWDGTQFCTIGDKGKCATS
jgi:hypothetical protein